MLKLHVKKHDTVRILSGKDKGKQGKILKALPKQGNVIVEGINKVKKHAKPSLKVPQGGIITKEAPIHACKVQPICPNCLKTTRISHLNNHRTCTHCHQSF